MKKLAVFLMALSLLATPIYAADLDLGTLSDEDLQLLQGRIEAELLDRQIPSGSVAYAGYYICGKDIKAGRYMIAKNPDDEDGVMIALYDNEEDCRNDENSLEAFYANEYNSYFVSIADEQALYLSNVAIVIELPEASFAP